MNYNTHEYSLVLKQAIIFLLLSLSKKLGGDERIRTADPPLAKRMLYQLSYIPAQSFRAT